MQSSCFVYIPFTVTLLFELARHPSSPLSFLLTPLDHLLILLYYYHILISTQFIRDHLSTSLFKHSSPHHCLFSLIFIYTLISPKIMWHRLIFMLFIISVFSQQCINFDSNSAPASGSECLPYLSPQVSFISTTYHISH